MISGAEYIAESCSHHFWLCAQKQSARLGGVCVQDGGRRGQLRGTTQGAENGAFELACGARHRHSQSTSSQGLLRRCV